MPIQFDCSNCKNFIVVPDSLAGKNYTCEHCGQELIVPLITFHDKEEVIEANNASTFSKYKSENFPDVWQALLLVFGYHSIGWIIVLIAGYLVGNTSTIIESLVYRLSLLEMITVSLIIFISSYFKKESFLSIIKLKKVKWNVLWSSLLATAGYKIMVLSGISSIYNIKYAFSQINSSKLPTSSSSSLEDIIIYWGSAILIAPIFEEIVFRRIILDGFLKRYDYRLAIFLSALIFGVFHFNWSQLFSATLIGIFIGYIYYRTRSLTLCILAHGLSNFIPLMTRILKYLLYYKPNSVFDLIATYNISLFITGLLLTIVGLHHFRKTPKVP